MKAQNHHHTNKHTLCPLSLAAILRNKHLHSHIQHRLVNETETRSPHASAFLQASPGEPASEQPKQGRCLQSLVGKTRTSESAKRKDGSPTAQLDPIPHLPAYGLVHKAFLNQLLQGQYISFPVDGRLNGPRRIKPDDEQLKDLGQVLLWSG